jgi:tetratricopeptide (TPR) repeat protein/predicted Ser/Thr protein kinase
LMTLSEGDKLGRYQFRAVIGAGGMGVVYRAYDPQLERLVAIKVLQRLEDKTHSGARLLEEARSASALNHPNVCTIYEVSEEGKCAFIAMEYVDGRSLDTLLPGALPIDEAIEYAYQIADALAHAHEHAVTHGDLKSANVIISSDGRVKVVDFGLARRQPRDTDRTFSAATSAVVGTLYTMAPEQLTGSRADAQSDIWALGVVLYEMLSGSRPFVGQTSAELASAILRDPPAALPNRISAGLHLIVNRCLAKNVAHRYRGAAEIRAALEPLRSRTPRVAGSADNFDVPQEWSIPPQPALASMDPNTIELVGREPEMAAIRSAWENARAGHRQLILLAGEPGIGKTRLTLEFGRSKAGLDAIVLLGRCDQEALVPYQPFVEALEWYVRACPVPVLRAQAADIEAVSELAALIRALARRISIASESIESNAEGRRYRLFEAVASLLSAAACHRPLILILEDIHWADRPTLLLLRHLLRSSHEAALLVIATYRETELDRTHPLADVLSDLRREPASRRVALRGLGGEQVSKFITASIGCEAPPELIRLVVENTEGNPFFMSEVLRHLEEAGTLERLKSGTARTAGEDLGLPEGVRETIGRRLARLSETCHRLFGLAAVVGREFDFSVLQALADVPEERILDAIDEGVDAHLIQEVAAAPGRYAFTHALIRETLYGQLTGTRRIRLHRRVAEALERLAAPGHKPLADLAYHYGQSALSGDAEKAVEYALQAAELAAAGFALEEAARFYGVALKAVDFLPDGPIVRTRKLDLHFRRGRAFADVGQWAAAKAELAAALDLLGPDEQERRCEVLVELAKSAFWLFDIPAVRRFATEALAIGEVLGRNDLCGDATAWLAASTSSDGDVPTALEINRQAIRRAGGVRSFALCQLTIAPYWVGRTREAIELSSEAVANARASRDPAFRMVALEHLGLGLTAAGRYDEARLTFEEVREFGLRYGVMPLLARGIAMSTGLSTPLADFARAQALALEARDLASRLSLMPSFVSAGIDLLLIYSRRHEPERAESLVDGVAQAVANASGWHGWLWRLRLWQARAEMAFELGDWHKAFEAAEHSIEQSHARHRIKYEALGFATRARARSKLDEMPLALEDAARAVAIARKLGDPALLVDMLVLHLALDGNDQLAAEARQTVEQVLSKLSDERLRRCFLESESVRLALNGPSLRA